MRVWVCVQAQDGLEDKNVTIRTTSNPADPFGFKLPEFGGSLMPHRQCADDGSSTGKKKARCLACMHRFEFVWISRLCMQVGVVAGKTL